MKVHDRIRSLRERENISREDFAQKIGVTYAALSKYETGSRAPDFDTLIKIADYFDVTTDYLLGRSEKKVESKKESLFPFDVVGISQNDFENLSAYQQEVLQWAASESGPNFMNRSENVLDMMEQLEIAYEVYRAIQNRKNQNN